MAHRLLCRTRWAEAAVMLLVASFSGWIGRVSLGLLGLCACSEPALEPVLPYPVGQALVFGESPAGGVQTPMGPSCTSEACAAVEERCGPDVYAEVVLAARGGVLDVICYRGDLGVQAIDPAPFDIIGTESETVFVFDSLDDGADLIDDVVVTGESDVLYGVGAEVSVLGAGLGIDAPSTIVRGLKIRGDVTVDQNEAKLSLVEIYGDLTINGNQVTLSESVVHGQVHIIGSDVVLARNLLEGTSRQSGTNLACALNQRFDDRNGNREIEDAELGGEVLCE